MNNRKPVDTVKALKEFLQDLPDDMPVMIEELRQTEEAYYNNIGLKVKSMKPILKTNIRWEPDDDGKECLVIY